MKRKMLYSSYIKELTDRSSAILMAKIWGFIGIIAVVIVLLFGG